MQDILLIMILIILWVISLIFSFCGGLGVAAHSLKAKRQKAATPQNSEKSEFQKKQIREYENFLSYSGKPQGDGLPRR